MKHNFLLAFLLLLTPVYSNAPLAPTHADAPLETGWSVTKEVSPCAYTAEFGIRKAEASLGKVIRTGLFTPRYYYDLYDANNVLQIRGITRAFSLGLLFAWGTEIDLYDADQLVGMIRGEIYTTSSAQFSFYDGNAELIASAYLNDESHNFLVVSAQRHVLAELKWKSFEDASAWEMKPLQRSLGVDERVLQIFAGFVADFQKSFIRPSKKEASS
jgi:hypothetical protein